ncbi:hypothetical protein [Nevskia ramosa]|uniref:hypothetical protein n=1 Tax=Nevskia ramosa TaxID=64002 RepID=UPI003D14C68B
MSRRITVAALHKMLDAFVEQGHGRKPIAVDKSSFRHPCEEDGVSIVLDLARVELQWIPKGDGDGGIETRKDGNECGEWTIVLGGGASPETAR